MSRRFQFSLKWLLALMSLLIATAVEACLFLFVVLGDSHQSTARQLVGLGGIAATATAATALSLWATKVSE